jgi:glutamate 5-kinase
VVVVRDRNKREIGRGIVNYSVNDLNQTTEKKGKLEVIHCDNLVLSGR